jgi:hypothetical protein
LGGLINARGLKKIDDFQEKHQWPIGQSFQMDFWPGLLRYGFPLCSFYFLASKYSAV